jgi:hypothetical protein
MNERIICHLCRQPVLIEHTKTITLQYTKEEVEETRICILCYTTQTAKDEQLAQLMKEVEVIEKTRESRKSTPDERGVGGGTVEQVYEAITLDERPGTSTSQVSTSIQSDLKDGELRDTF